MKYQYYPIYLILIFLVCSYYFGYTPLLILFIYVIASFIAYMAYAKDKSAAQRGQWRISENTLHLCSLFCGWPGAVLAQQKLRHKTKKMSFRIVFWFTLLINISVIAWFHTPQGSNYLRDYMRKLEYVLVNTFDENNGITVVLFLTKFRICFSQLLTKEIQ